MENEAPKYATWIPEAGGYVANGKVVSKSPMYDNGQFKTSVDTSLFSNTQAQNTVQQTGMQTLNTKGSGTDVNSAMTGAGSLGSLNTNTATTGNPLSTQAIESPLTNVKPQDLMSQINQKYLDAVANNDYKAMIDALTEASNADGVDRTEMINNLWDARGKKIRENDDSYIEARQQIKQAISALNTELSLTKDEQKAKEIQQQIANLQAQDNELANKQQAYRDMVGYNDQMTRDMQAQQQSSIEEFKSRWRDGFNTITSMMMQEIPALLNFQYDPYQDTALQVAQGYAVSRVKETMNATGMYNSSMTQRAIAKAVSELVPIYEQMSREEAMQKFNLLQQTAQFLMNAEQFEFEMWQANIEMKWKEADQKQKAIDNANNNANVRGWYTNEEAMLVGVAPGTESSESRKIAEEEQRKIASEIRGYEQDMAIAEYNKTAQLEYLREQYRQMKEYYKYQLDNPQTKTNSSDRKVTIKTTGNNGEEVTITMDYEEAVEEGYIDGGIKNEGGSTTYIDPNTGETYTVGNGDFLKALKTEDGTGYDMNKVESFIKNDLRELEDPAEALSYINSEIVMKNIKDIFGEDFQGNRDKSMNAFKKAYQNIEDFATLVKDSGTKNVEYALIGRDMKDANGNTVNVPGLIQNDINELVRQINISKNFDNVWGDWDLIHGDDKAQRFESEANAKRDIYNLMANSENSLIKNYVTPQFTFLNTDRNKVEEAGEQRLAENTYNFMSSPAGDMALLWANPMVGGVNTAVRSFNNIFGTGTKNAFQMDVDNYAREQEVKKMAEKSDKKTSKK